MSNAFERLKYFAGASAKVVHLDDVFGGERPAVHKLHALYKKNIGNILVFNDAEYGSCYVKDYKDSKNYTLIYRQDRNSYLIHGYVNGKDYEMIIDEDDFRNLKKL